MSFPCTALVASPPRPPKSQGRLGGISRWGYSRPARANHAKIEYDEEIWAGCTDAGSCTWSHQKYEDGCDSIKRLVRTITVC